MTLTLTFCVEQCYILVKDHRGQSFLYSTDEKQIMLLLLNDTPIVLRMGCFNFYQVHYLNLSSQEFIISPYLDTVKL